MQIFRHVWSCDAKEFWRCCNCRKLYWEGGAWCRSMRAVGTAALGSSEQEEKVLRGVGRWWKFLLIWWILMVVDCHWFVDRACRWSLVQSSAFRGLWSFEVSGAACLPWGPEAKIWCWAAAGVFTPSTLCHRSKFRNLRDIWTISFYLITFGIFWPPSLIHHMHSASTLFAFLLRLM